MHPMDKTTISLPVSAETARWYNEASEDERRKIQLLLNLWLDEIATSQRLSLSEIMDRISDRAQARGLTPEILESLLK